jgi:TolB-like protein
MSLPPGLRDFVAELRRRRVVAVAAIYFAVAWLVLQIADLVVPGLLLPEWTYRLVLLLVILGFPLALVLAWAFEVTPDGVRRTARVSRTGPGAGDQPRATRPWRRAIWGAVFLCTLTAAWWIGRATPSRVISTGPPATVAEDVAVTPPVSVAVLPFVNMSGDSEQEFFSEGISEELLNLLAGVSKLQVISRTSSFAFKDQRLTAEQLGDTLHARYLVGGSVRRDHRRVRITAQVIDTETGAHMWSDAWNRDLQHIFEVQEEIAARVVDQLKISLLGEGPTVESADPKAYVLVLQARHMAHENSEQSVLGAIDLYKQALAIDSAYAEAWSGLAEAYIAPVYYLAAAPGADPFVLAGDAADQALVRDSTQVGAYRVLGSLARIRGDLAGAARLYERAWSLSPGNSVGWQIADFLISLGRPADAIRLARYMIVRDPVDWVGYSTLGGAYLASERPADAVAPLQKAQALNPSAAAPYFLLCEALLDLNRPDSALAVIKDEPVREFRLMGLTKAYDALGRTEDSNAALSELIDTYGLDWPLEVAILLASRGDTERAFRWLDRAVERDDSGLSQIWPNSEKFTPFKDDPRWRRFLERIGRTPERLAAVKFDPTLPAHGAKVR